MIHNTLSTLILAFHEQLEPSPVPDPPLSPPKILSNRVKQKLQTLSPLPPLNYSLYGSSMRVKECQRTRFEQGTPKTSAAAVAIHPLLG